MFPDVIQMLNIAVSILPNPVITEMNSGRKETIIRNYAISDSN